MLVITINAWTLTGAFSKSSLVLSLTLRRPLEIAGCSTFFFSAMKPEKSRDGQSLGEATQLINH